MSLTETCFYSRLYGIHEIFKKQSDQHNGMKISLKPCLDLINLGQAFVLESPVPSLTAFNSSCECKIQLFYATFNSLTQKERGLRIHKKIQRSFHQHLTIDMAEGWLKSNQNCLTYVTLKVTNPCFIKIFMKLLM